MSFQLGTEMHILFFIKYLLLLENFTMEHFFADVKKCVKYALC
jgi:hypothetical protein